MPQSAKPAQDARSGADSPDDLELAGLGKPDRSPLHVLLILLGPLGLLVVWILGMWIATLDVQRSVVVQLETQWRSGEQLAVRAQLLDAERNGVEDTTARATVIQDGARWQVGELAPVPRGGLAQGEIQLPTLDLGAAQLELEISAPGFSSFTETVDVEVVEQRAARQGELTISTSTLQWGDDTEPQPEHYRIDLRPYGRLLAGFDNELMIRVTDRSGRPWQGPAEVFLVDGAYAGEKASERDTDPPRLFAGETDPLGLIAIPGMLVSEVVRVEVRLHPPGPEKVPTRRFRHVSFPGGVQIYADPVVARAGDEVRLKVSALRAKRAVFLDAHGDDGAWLAALPPLPGSQPGRPMRLPESTPPGFVQVEGYAFTNNPGEGSAVARIHVTEADPASVESLPALVERQRELLKLPRIEKDFDVERESAYLDHVLEVYPDLEGLHRVQRWLVGSLPLQVLGPPKALNTRPREEAAVHETRATWVFRLRLLLFGGGGLYIALLAYSLYREYRRTAKRLADAMDGDATSVLEARRSMLARAAVLLGIMVAGLAFTILLMENLVWTDWTELP